MLDTTTYYYINTQSRFLKQCIKVLVILNENWSFCRNYVKILFNIISINVSGCKMFRYMQAYPQGRK